MLTVYQEKDCREVQDKISDLNDQEEESKRKIKQYSESIEALNARLQAARGESVEDSAPLTATKVCSCNRCNEGILTISPGGSWT